MGAPVAMGLLFYPRGGSAQVTRYLALALERRGRPVHLVSGSLGAPGARSHAGTFFAGLDVTAADFTGAVEMFERGGDPMAAPMPMHPSYEDRTGVPDRLFASLDDAAAAHQVAAWTPVLAAGVAAARVLHLHHLTPQHEAARTTWPQLPVVAHLHGTELKLVDGIRRRRALAARLGTDLAGMADRAIRLTDTDGVPANDLSDDEEILLRTTRWSAWRHADACERRLVGAARAADRVLVLSDHEHGEARRLLGVDEERIELVPNGVDTDRFDRLGLTDAERLALWHRWLVDDPQGWDESGRPGSVAYTSGDLAAFVDPVTGAPRPVLLFVGRFLGFKRVPLLVRAYQRARHLMACPAPLVVWGGSPGEWEGEHPVTVARDGGADGIFFAGWRGHDDLVEGINCSAVLAAPSVDEPFGQVYLEAMACGRPVIATATGGPVSFVNTEPSRPDGWLVAPDDEGALADALVAAVDDADERARRGAHAYDQIRRRYAWRGIAEHVDAIYDRLGA